MKVYVTRHFYGYRHLLNSSLECDMWFIFTLCSGMVREDNVITADSREARFRLWCGTSAELSCDTSTSHNLLQNVSTSQTTRPTSFQTRYLWIITFLHIYHFEFDWKICSGIYSCSPMILEIHNFQTLLWQILVPIFTHIKWNCII